MLAQIAAIFQTINLIISSAKEIMGFIDKNKNEAWFRDSAELFQELRNAKNDDERKNLAIRLRDIIRRL